jgi:fucose permease
MWGVGASTGPYIMSAALTGGGTWNTGYRIVGIIQIVLSVLIFMSLPLWKKASLGEEKQDEEDEYKGRPIPLKDVIRFKGAKEIMLTFFCYSAIEQTCSLWASGYMVFGRGMNTVRAAGYAGLFFIGITVGRALSGFLTMKFNDDQMMRIGEGIIALGIILIFLPSDIMVIIGLIVTGFGCAPVYPSIIHSTPIHFGRDKSQAMVGIQMAAAYIGTTLMPPVFGVIAQNINVNIFPFYLAASLILMTIMYETVVKKTSGGHVSE